MLTRGIKSTRGHKRQGSEDSLLEIAKRIHIEDRDIPNGLKMFKNTEEHTENLFFESNLALKEHKSIPEEEQQQNQHAKETEILLESFIRQKELGKPFSTEDTEIILNSKYTQSLRALDNNARLWANKSLLHHGLSNNKESNKLPSKPLKTNDTHQVDDSDAITVQTSNKRYKTTGEDSE
jgi:hypothetical protein